MATALTVAAMLTGCDGGPTDPGNLRFGQIGDTRIELVTPLQLGTGSLAQTLTWNSDGVWRLEETIRYRGEVGDRGGRRSPVVGGALAGAYAQWIAQVNDVPALRLFIPELEPGLDPTCGPTRSLLTLTIRDARRDEEVSWTRCVAGSLETLTTTRAGPDPAAGRVAAAVTLARDFTLSETFRSDYSASLPFATLARGEDAQGELTEPRIITDAAAWTLFWRELQGTEATPPEVDFSRDVVIVGAVGLRFEAGDSVEVRRVLPADDATFVELVERVPGDFCSPAERRHYPFHVVRAPAVPLPVRFVEPVAVERVPCGL